MNNEATNRRPATWVPSLYFAQGLPYHVVMAMALLMYKSMGVPNDRIAFWTGLLGFAWVVNPFWSPFLEASRNKKQMVVVLQIVGGIFLLLAGVALQLPLWFALSIAALAIVALASATHDIAANGLYMASLPARQQAAYSGWMSAFFNIAKIVVVGGLVILAGYFEKRMAVPLAWAIVFVILGIILAALGVYHWWALPAAQNTRSNDTSEIKLMTTVTDVVRSFFAKKGIVLWLLFVVLYQAGYGQIATIGPLFLRDAAAAGGLGLHTDQVGAIYGTIGALTIVAGAIAGGYFTVWLGLRRAMIFLILAMNLPNLAFYFLSVVMPSNLYLIAAAIGIENLGLGFGYTGVMLFMMQVIAPGKYQTSHYAISTGFMALGVALFKMISGDIQMALGYEHFFLWVVIAAAPSLLMAFFIVPANIGAQAHGDK